MSMLQETKETKEKITLIDKVVKVIDTTHNIDNTCIIPFMYPDFHVKDDIFFDYDNNVIISTKYSKERVDEIRRGSKHSIILCDSGLVDVDFTDKEVILQILKSKTNISKEKMSMMLDMEDLDFWKAFKKYWVCNISKDEDIDVSIYNLYMLLGSKRLETMKMYLKLREIYSEKMIYSSIISFIEKSLNPKLQSNNERYNKLLNTFREKQGKKAQRALAKCYEMKCTSDKDMTYRTMYLLYCIGSGKLI